jgi:hypothetical protein
MAETKKHNEINTAVAADGCFKQEYEKFISMQDKKELHCHSLAQI